MSRLARLAAGLEVPLLVLEPTNVRYLTGLESSNAALLVDPSGATTLFTDFRYAEVARAIPGVDFVPSRRDVVGEVAGRIEGLTLGFEADHVSYASAERLRAGGAELVPTSRLVEQLRAVKEPGEIEVIRAVAAISDEVYGDLAGERFTGRTERELAWLAERRFRERGADGLSFPPIVASGVHGSRPHAVPQDAEIAAGTLVTLDLGGTLEGYCSDCTRTFATGPLPDRLAEAYALCAAAQLDTLAAVRAGVAASAVDAASRTQIVAAGLGDAYGHGAGHGVGLQIHEAPTLRAESLDVLEAGNVVTAEPGLYLEGLGGVRIEDLVVVTADGCERLTRFTKDLVTVA